VRLGDNQCLVHHPLAHLPAACRAEQGPRKRQKRAAILGRLGSRSSQAAAGHLEGFLESPAPPQEPGNLPAQRRHRRDLADAFQFVQGLVQGVQRGGPLPQCELGESDLGLRFGATAVVQPAMQLHGVAEAAEGVLVGRRGHSLFT